MNEKAVLDCPACKVIASFRLHPESGILIVIVSSVLPVFVTTTVPDMLSQGLASLSQEQLSCHSNASVLNGGVRCTEESSEIESTRIIAIKSFGISHHSSNRDN